MGGVAIGPLLLSAPRFAVVVGIFTYLLASSLIARRAGRQLSLLVHPGVGAGILAARIGFVALNWSAYAADPLGVLAFWQGGFSWQAGVAGSAAVLVARLSARRGKCRS